MSRFPDLRNVAWRKSSYSDGGQNNCVEVGEGLLALVPVRDSKVPGGPRIAFPVPAWGSFLTALRGDGPPAA